MEAKSTSLKRLRSVVQVAVKGTLARATYMHGMMKAGTSFDSHSFNPLVKGIFNLTIALADKAFSRMSISDWKISVNPKRKST